MQCGIYKIINRLNGNYYIGSTNNFSGRCGRKYTHRYNLTLGIHPNCHLQNAWNKYGESNFDFVFIESIEEENLLIVEQQYLHIAQQESRKCYNKKFIAGGGAYGEVSEATRQKQSKRKQGQKNPRYKSRNYMLRHKMSGQLFNGTLYDFVQLTGSCRKDVNELLLWGMADSVKGWIPLDEDVKEKRRINKKPRKNTYVFTEEHRKNLRENWKSRKVTSYSPGDTYTNNLAYTI